MVEFVMSSGVIFLILVGWLYVQETYRRFAERHPGLGPFRQEGGCDGGCSCSQGSCPTSMSKRKEPVVTVDLIGSVPQRKDLQESGK